MKVGETLTNLFFLFACLFVQFFFCPANAYTKNMTLPLNISIERHSLSKRTPVVKSFLSKNYERNSRIVIVTNNKINTAKNLSKPSKVAKVSALRISRRQFFPSNIIYIHDNFNKSRYFRGTIYYLSKRAKLTGLFFQNHYGNSPLHMRTSIVLRL